jgi:DNA-binding CsgD family transcriptional regulator
VPTAGVAGPWGGVGGGGAGWDGQVGEALTASERRIAELAAEGLTNREIAQTLFVTARTVEGHLTHVFYKLDLKARTNLSAALAAPTSASRA